VITSYIKRIVSKNYKEGTNMAEDIPKRKVLYRKKMAKEETIIFQKERIEDLKDQVKELKTEIRDLSKVNDTLEDKYRKLKGENVLLNEKVDDNQLFFFHLYNVVLNYLKNTLS